MHSIKQLFAVAMLLALAACQTPVRAPAEQDRQWLQDPARFASVSVPQNWRYTAKVGLLLNDKSEQANLTWQNQNSDAGLQSQVRLFGPLGVGAVKLEIEPSRAALTDNQNRVYRNADAEALLSEVVGWPLPVNALRFWLFAQPAADSVFEYQLDDAGQISALRQRGWRIEYKDWRDFNGRTLPRKVFAYKSFAGEQGAAAKGEVTVKLITRSWRFE